MAKDNKDTSVTTLNDETSTESCSATLKEIGPYLVIKTLGEGTFGKVRLCEHKLTQKRVWNLLI